MDTVCADAALASHIVLKLDGWELKCWLLIHNQAPALSAAAAQQAGGQAAPAGEPASLLLTALLGIPDTALLRACADAAAMRAPLTQVGQPCTVMALHFARHTRKCQALLILAKAGGAVFST